MREGIQKRHFQNIAIPNQNQNQNQTKPRATWDRFFFLGAARGAVGVRVKRVQSRRSPAPGPSRAPTNLNMGNEASTPDEYPDEFAKFDGIETLGYRVLGVQPNSPAARAGLVSFLDFLVGANGKMLLGSGEGLEEGDEYDDIDFPALLKENENKDVELLVHNIKSNSQRLVTIKPTSDWGGAGLIGVTIRLDNYGGADERLIRVLSVEHNSPAQIAGLCPMNDFLLGTTSTSFESDKILAEVLTVHEDRIVELYVYSAESDMVRVTALMPTRAWGSRGLLGAEVGTGYLHGFPKKCRVTDGTSVERKVRTGVRPTEAASAKKANERAQESATKSEDAMVDLTAVTDTVSGKTLCFAEEMEMEPTPPPHKSAESMTNGSSRQAPVETESEHQTQSVSGQRNGTKTIEPYQKRPPSNGEGMPRTPNISSKGYTSNASEVFASPPAPTGVYSHTNRFELPPPPMAQSTSNHLKGANSTDRYPPSPSIPSTRCEVDLR